MRSLWWGALQAIVISTSLMGCQTMEYTAFKEPPPSTAMPHGSPALVAPAGFSAFCFRNPTECTEDDGTVTNVHMDEATWAQLQKVNAEVNWAIQPESDKDHYGSEEYWAISTDGYGDCEDYALTKRKELIALGLPKDALRLAILRMPRGETHAVLTVASDMGDYVLDNLTSYVLPWSRTDYLWVEREDRTEPSGWVSLQVASIDSDAATAGITPSP